MQQFRSIKRTATLVMTLSIALITPVLAATTSENPLVARLKALRPDLPIVTVHATPVAGIQGIELEGGTFLYVTEDGRHLFAGDLWAMDTNLTNLTDTFRNNKRMSQMSKIPIEEMIVFSPKKATRQAIFVFTDVDCGYCRKLHLEMQAINDLGIEVRYLAYPREGLGSEAYRKLVSAWCADDRQTALTRLKAGQPVTAKTCANPIADQYKLGQLIGVTGTPAIITQTGELLPGYMPAKELARALGLK
jgi:thiol:disulfide interchange protein DsbC